MSAPLLDVTFLKPMKCDINGRKPYTKYEILVSSSLHNLSWIVFKRYSDFVTLNDSLITLIDCNPKLQSKNIVLSSLPRRRLFGGMNDDVVLERKEKLELYSRDCLKYKLLCHEDLILDFLNVPEEIKMMMDTLKTYNIDRDNKYNKSGSKDCINISRLAINNNNNNNKHENINEEQVNILLNKLYYQENRSTAIKNFQEWYFKGFGHKFNPHLIRKLLIGYNKYIGLIQSCKHILYKPSSKNSLSLLVKLFDIERNKYARMFIQVFINLNPEMYGEMDLHRHIGDCTKDDAFEIISIFNHYLPHLHYKIYVNSEEAYEQFIKWNEIQSNSYIVGSYFDKEEIEEKQMRDSVFDYNTYKNNPKSLINLSHVIFTKYCEFMYENDDNYRAIPKINEKYSSISLNVGIQKDFYNHHWKIKISFISSINAIHIYNFLRMSYIGNNDKDCESYGWDKKLIHRKIEKKLTDNEYIMHETYKSYNSPYRFRDFVVLRSFRGGNNIGEQYENKKFFIVFSSITNYDNLCKKDNGVTRCIMFPSGFEITQYGNNKSQIIYRLHMTEEGINIINADLLGECDELFQSLIRINSLIKIHNSHQNQNHS